jgi:hypothetical protein
MDIVVTIPKSEYKNDDKETEFLNSNPDAYQFWTFKRLPTRLHVGDRIYFVKNNKIESSMRVIRIPENSREICETIGRVWEGKFVYINDLRYENLDFKVKGFQGFRYRWW